MKRSILFKHIFAVVATACCFSACQQDIISDDATVEVKVSKPLISRSESCEITTTQAGQLASLISEKEEELEFPMEAVKELSISGPINKADINCIRDYKEMERLDLTGCQFYDEVYENGVGYVYREVDWVPYEMFRNLKSECEVLLPDYITYIKSDAFYGSAITSISIPDNVVKMDGYVFYDCKKLEKVELPIAITEIPSNTFRNCNSLKEIEIPNKVVTIGDYAFCACNFTGIVIPNSVETIKYSAFESCWSITEIEIPSSVKKIEDRAFRWTGLTHITIPETVTSIGNSLIAGCEFLEGADWPESYHTIPSNTFDGCKKLQFLIPEHITEIGACAFRNCSNITTITGSPVKPCVYPKIIDSL